MSSLAGAQQPAASTGAPSTGKFDTFRTTRVHSTIRMAYTTSHMRWAYKSHLFLAGVACGGVRTS